MIYNYIRAIFFLMFSNLTFCKRNNAKINSFNYFLCFLIIIIIFLVNKKNLQTAILQQKKDI